MVPLEELELVRLLLFIVMVIMYIVCVVRKSSLFVGCHLKFHKDHFDNSEEFVGPCKGQTIALVFYLCVSVSYYY